MAKFWKALLQPVHLDQELVRKHESDVEYLLPGVGAVFGICIVVFAAWDFVIEPEIAFQSLAIRSSAVLLASLIYHPKVRERFAPLDRAGYMFSVYAVGVIVAEIQSAHPSSVAAITACIATLSLVSIRVRTFLYMATVPSIVFAVAAVYRLPPLEAINALMMYLVGLVIALVIMLATRDFRRRSSILQHELVRISRHDSLTGVFNRGYVTELALREVELARRYGRPMAVAMLDIDHFKAINDTYGHDIGDRVIQKLARVCAGSLRTTDHFGRFGGEEFIVVMPETGTTAAAECAERLRASVATASVDSPSGEVRFTVSIGVAVLPQGASSDWQGLLKRADVALYRAKSAGRNQVALNEAPFPFAAPAAGAVQSEN
ncbi:MAG TPA: diguanylate cyclase [Telluria sp.]|nr:diguanylate cyclase [Telluria sp.]